MTPDEREPSLSDHEQRILAEIERNLAAEDPDFVRNVSEVRPTNDSIRMLRFSILGLALGLGMLIGFLTHTALGVLGFVVMLASIVGLVTSIRNLASAGRSPTFGIRDALKRAEDRMRTKKPEE